MAESPKVNESWHVRSFYRLNRRRTGFTRSNIAKSSKINDSWHMIDFSEDSEFVLDLVEFGHLPVKSTLNRFLRSKVENGFSEIPPPQDQWVMACDWLFYGIFGRIGGPNVCLVWLNSVSAKIWKVVNLIKGVKKDESYDFWHFENKIGSPHKCPTIVVGGQPIQQYPKCVAYTAPNFSNKISFKQRKTEKNQNSNKIDKSKNDWKSQKETGNSFGNPNSACL